VTHSGGTAKYISDGLAALQSGDFEKAFALSEAALRAAPNHPMAFKLGAVAASALRNWRALKKLTERWLAGEPENYEAARLHAAACFELGATAHAADLFEKAVLANPAFAERWAMLARCRLAAFQYDKAEAAFDKALTMDPRSADALFGLSELKLHKGALEEAEALALDALESDDSHALAYSQLAWLRRGDLNERLVDKMQRMARDPKRRDEDRAALYYALGSVFHRRERFGAAMDHFKKANDITQAILEREGAAYDPEIAEAFHRRLRKLRLTSPALQRFEPGPAIPIFIVGMPRSGTTLVESVIAAHPDVFGAGELKALLDIRDAALAWIDENDASSLSDAPPDQLRAWRTAYFDQYPDIGGARFVTDKQMLNYQSVGLIRALFPEAKIIHLRRRPVDVGFSIYRNRFSKSWSFASRLQAIAHCYGEYARIMTAWAESFCKSPETFQYEEFVADFEAQARRLIAACDLSWTDACNAFHRSQRTIATFSAVEARQPLRRTPPSAREAYGAMLQPLIDGLERVGVDLESGALRGNYEKL